MAKFVKTVCVTPLTSGGVIPTLMHCSYDGAKWYNGVSTGYYPRPIVVEVWECEDGETVPQTKTGWQDLKKSEQTAIERISERGVFNESKDKIVRAVQELKPGQYFRLRRLTPSEFYRFMGCNDSETDKLMSVVFRREPDMSRVSKKKSDSLHYGLAGNSIVVDVIERIFENMFIKGSNNR